MGIIVEGHLAAWSSYCATDLSMPLVAGIKVVFSLICPGTGALTQLCSGSDRESASLRAEPLDLRLLFSAVFFCFQKMAASPVASSSSMLWKQLHLCFYI